MVVGESQDAINREITKPNTASIGGMGMYTKASLSHLFRTTNFEFYTRWDGKQRVITNPVDSMWSEC